MASILYDYADGKEPNPITSWLQGLPLEQLAQLNLKIKQLKECGDQILPNFVTAAVGSVDVQEIKVNGRMALRLLICRGPIDSRLPPQMGKVKAPYPAYEFTLLFGSEERDNRYVPHDAVKQAENRRLAIVADNRKREPHVHVRPPNDTGPTR
ncbi:MAG: hypothetical protein H8K03_20050 [Nitrospira sp.]